MRLVASKVRLSVSQGPDAMPAVHCAVSREHGDEAGRSGSLSPPGLLAFDVDSAPESFR